MIKTNQKLTAPDLLVVKIYNFHAYSPFIIQHNTWIYKMILGKKLEIIENYENEQVVVRSSVVKTNSK